MKEVVAKLTICCATAAHVPAAAGQWIYQPYLLWVGVVLLIVSFFVNGARSPASQRARTAN